MTARFRLEGPYGFDGAENPRRHGETCAAHTARDYDYCSRIVGRTEMEFLRACRVCPDRACRRARRCLGPEFSCRAANSDPRLLDFSNTALRLISPMTNCSGCGGRGVCRTS
ncbi:hypothetical protein CSIRO_0145 [Bradyrhizobiaceae bacterium SG-6C]|nr:hypothetical protein CSIRO_0145 [Bradyrhizobiaceae bacterium SG-6C]